ncbi:amidase family protein [Sulfitobacter sp. D35]|uniref:amidase family protein n=1 Tax=Sulfitobacter sp. D35 TaxID=3083252 RepID=UPI00296ED58A|nr:amidase family protein [Sulfitobacter sp. D35]MDW4499380.1 amidase family protein [Sulfitobacter sp. D35]
MTELFRLSAVEIAAGIRARAFSAVEVTEAHLARLEAVNPAINAVVQDGSTEALETARRIDEALARGEEPGLMAGVPAAIKVNVDQAGFATTNGLRLLRDNVARTDAPFVAQMRAAGAVFVGRTNTPAFSLRWFTDNGLNGQTLNPRNAALTPGGSSGGAAAAVAAGICPVAHGTDIAGSVRYPAYACGVHGLRPSFGRVATLNETSGDRFIGAQLMAVSGPIARRIADLELAHRVMSAPDRRDPWQVPAPHEGPAYARRAALCLAPDGMPVAPEVRAALVAAARVLEQAGWTVEEVDCPPMRPAAQINAVLWMAETELAVAGMMDREGDGAALFVYRMMCAETGPADLGRVMTALKDRAGLVRAWELFLDRYPLLICPVSGELPFAQQSDVRSEANFRRIYEAQLTQRALPALGMPALSVATGFAGEAPLGVQLVAGRFREDILFAAGGVLEAAGPAPEVADPA